MQIILFDDSTRQNLLPLTFTRPVADLRVGILTIKEKWEALTNLPCSFLTEDYLQEKFKADFGSENFYINGSVLPSQALWDSIQELENEELITVGEIILVRRSESKLSLADLKEKNGVSSTELEVTRITATHDIFTYNDAEIRKDFDLITKGRKSANPSDTNIIIGKDYFIEEGATIEAATINTSTGPVYVGKEANILEGSLIRGPFALCNKSTIKLGAKIYGATTVGPNCKVGGEISNVVFHSFSNKGHDGFLGNSVIGQWCNLGADTNSSNLKNNYAPVKLWNYNSKRFLNTGLQFCGLIMGDHSKCGINTMFNTGTVVGVSANIFGAGFPRNFIPAFTWGGSSGYSTYTMNKAFETARKVMERRNIELNELEQNILKEIFKITSEYRIWEKKPINI